MRDVRSSFSFIGGKRCRLVLVLEFLFGLVVYLVLVVDLFLEVGLNLKTEMFLIFEKFCFCRFVVGFIFRYCTGVGVGVSVILEMVLEL